MSRMSDKNYKHVYAVIRIDRFQGNEVSLKDKVTVKEVIRTKEKAISEVERLNKVNADKGCEYFWQITRLKNP